MNINTVAISGNITRDPEIRSTASGKSVCTFTIASNESRKGAQGEWVDYANYVECVAFGGIADWISKAAGKGTKLCVVGRLAYQAWEKDGKKRSKLQVMVDKADIMEKHAHEQVAEVYDEEIPF